MPNPFLARLIAFAKSPQGRRLANQAVNYARTEKGRKQIAAARQKAVSAKDRAVAARAERARRAAKR